jgi:hypothetical protein
MSDFTVYIGNEKKTLQQVIDDPSIPAARRALAVICLKQWNEGLAAIEVETYKAVGDKGEVLDLINPVDVRQMWLSLEVDHTWYSNQPQDFAVYTPATPSSSPASAPEPEDEFVD